MNAAPEWKPGMPRIDSMAAHPSMQRKSDAQLRDALDSYRAELRDSESLPRGRDWNEYRAGVIELIRATERALEWRA